MANNVAITDGQGQSSVAAEQIGTVKYQQIKVVGGEVGSTSVWGITPDGSGKVSVVGTVSVSIAGGTVGVSILGGLVRASIVGLVPVQTSNTSVITVIQSPSIVGTYDEDAAHTTADKGVFVLGVRNDTLSSVTSADLDYSQHAVGPVGEIITAPAPITKWVQGTADLRVVLGASVTAIAAQGTSVFTYIQAAQLANMGSASVLVTFGGGLGSILGYTIAPAGGGSNIRFFPALKTGENSAFTASISGAASVLVSAQGFISKT